MDLTTDYLGLKLQNPLVASASPLSRTIDGIRQLEEAGAGAIVLYSLFEEQIEWDATPGMESGFPDWGHEPVGPDEYLDFVSIARRAVGIPVIGSLNGTCPGEWTRYARLIQDAGADGLELNLFYIPTDPSLTAADVEQQYIDTLREVRANVTLPLAVKISPYFSALPNIAQRLAEAGADGLVLFNRFYQPDLDPESRRTDAPALSLSTADDLRLPLRWISLLHGRISADFALTGGVHSGQDVVKALMAGAKVAMTASEPLQHGVRRIREMCDELSRWMEAHHYDSIEGMIGQRSQQNSLADPGTLERAGYVTTLHSLGPETGNPFVARATPNTENAIASMPMATENEAAPSHQDTLRQTTHKSGMKSGETL